MRVGGVVGSWCPSRGDHGVSLHWLGVALRIAFLDTNVYYIHTYEFVLAVSIYIYAHTLQCIYLYTYICIYNVHAYIDTYMFHTYNM